MIAHELNGRAYAEMIGVGARHLKRFVNEVNDLNVFPIPDGDTGDNMMMTLRGGADVEINDTESISEAAEKVAKGMLLNARGNSGVILSQFFAGIADGFEGLDLADTKALEEAFKSGVKRAYDSVMTPTEGTILTVAKDATNGACEAGCEEPDEFMEHFVDSAKQSLERTPDLLHVLKEAGVVDSGGAGLVYIAEGMANYLTGEYDETDVAFDEKETKKSVSLDLDAFGPESELQFGYCTETLLRLQSSKCDYENFDVNIIRDFLQSIGNSIVCIKDGSIVKMHVHTMTPYKVLEFCQQYGEFLTIKIENMMLQHNNLETGAASESDKDLTPKKRSKLGIVVVANGEGIKNDFINMGVDEVIFGGQTMNPSAENFIQSFDRVNADDIFVLPNNGNILMAASQAASLYDKSNVHVIPTHSIGDAYAILGMLDMDGLSPAEIEESMKASMEGVETAEISKSIRDASLNGIDIKEGEYIGILKKEVVSSKKELIDAAKETVDRLNLKNHDILLVIRGKDCDESVSNALASYAKSINPCIEAVESDGKQDVYQFLLVAE